LNSQLENLDKDVQFKAGNCYSNTLYRTDKFEIRFICWKSLQKTPRHPHPENGCLMKILTEKRIEEKFINTRSIKTVYKKEEVGYIKASKSHILENSDTDSVSLHIYSPSGFYDTINKQ
jgi:Cysteine dioxygenase type I